MGTVDMIAVRATVTIKGTEYAAEATCYADLYDDDGGRTRTHARFLARAALEDVIREARPAMSIRDAFDNAHDHSTITTHRYTVDTPDTPF